MSHRCAHWMRQAAVRSECDTALETATQRLEGVDFDTIAFTGMSGCLFAPILAYTMKKEIACVRKSSMGTHSDCIVEGFYNTKKYIIVDDFIASGDTIKRIILKMLKHARDARCVGVYCYYKEDRMGKFSNGFLSPEDRLFQSLLQEALNIFNA